MLAATMALNGFFMSERRPRLAWIVSAYVKLIVASSVYLAWHYAIDGYASIGCWPCTEPSTDGRAGRWAGSGKTECGLHL